VCPARDFNDVTLFVEMLVDGVCVGDEVTLVALEQVVDGEAVVFARIAVKHVLFWGY